MALVFPNSYNEPWIALPSVDQFLDECLWVPEPSKSIQGVDIG